MMRAAREPADSVGQSVQRVLEVLDLLVRARQPMTGREIGDLLGVHQTTASRMVRALVAAGYARPAVGGGFLPGLRTFALGAEAADSFPLLHRLRQPMTAITESNPDFEVTLATLWQDQPLYFLRAIGGEPIPFSSRSNPLHLSTAGLRLLIERSDDEVIAALDRSSQRSGWDRPTAATPAGPAGVLEVARRQLINDSLVISSWLTPRHISGAITLDLPEPNPFVLALISTLDHTSELELRLKLADGRRLLERAYTARDESRRSQALHSAS